MQLYLEKVSCTESTINFKQLVGQFQQFAFGCITHNFAMCHYPNVEVCCCSDRFIDCIVQADIQYTGNICLLHPRSQQAIVLLGATGLCAQKEVTHVYVIFLLFDFIYKKIYFSPVIESEF